MVTDGQARVLRQKRMGSLALTNGVSLTWLSEQTGVAVGTILKHYGRFIHSSETDEFELANIETRVPLGHRLDITSTKRRNSPE